MAKELKHYSEEIYRLLVQRLSKPTITDLISDEGKRIDVAVMVLMRSVLFFCQFQENQSLEEWVKITPKRYREKMNHVFSFIFCSRYLAMSALSVSELDLPPTVRTALKLDLDNLWLGEPSDTYSDTTEDTIEGLRNQFTNVCIRYHKVCPESLVLKEALIFLFYGLIECNELILESRRLFLTNNGANMAVLVDNGRLEYLKSIINRR